MNRQIIHHFCEKPNFEEVIFLTEGKKRPCWKESIALDPKLPKGWYELSQLSKEDRIDFTKQYWLKILPYQPSLYKGIERFFRTVDDVIPLLVLDGKWSSRLVYSIKEDSTFFCGSPPMEEKELTQKESDFHFLPSTWKQFFRIHNGFGKLLEPGILPIEKIRTAKDKLILIALQSILHAGNRWIDPEDLWPFFEVSGLQSYHCFLTHWFPQGEMGTVYFSGIDYTISDVTSLRPQEVGAYPRFGDFLLAFLEGTEIIF